MSKTKIDYLDKVWNPMSGCRKISPGCANCYAERMSKRLAGRCGYPEEKPFSVALHPDRLNEPMRWKKPQVIGVCFMGDLFHEDVPDEFIGQVSHAMAACRWHTFIVLTKRPERMKALVTQAAPHVWLGVSAENQEQANARIPVLLSIPAAKRFVSIEPMLGPVDLTRIKWARIGVEKESYHRLGVPAPDEIWSLNNVLTARPADKLNPEKVGLDWVILGGESGPGARPPHPDWVRGVRDQCREAGVPFYFKQWGEWQPIDQWMPGPVKQNAVMPDGRWCSIHDVPQEVGAHRVVLVGKKAAGRLLDGKEYLEWPK